MSHRGSETPREPNERSSVRTLKAVVTTFGGSSASPQSERSSSLLTFGFGSRELRRVNRRPSGFFEPLGRLTLVVLRPSVWTSSPLSFSPRLFVNTLIEGSASMTVNLGLLVSRRTEVSCKEEDDSEESSTHPQKDNRTIQLE